MVFRSKVDAWLVAICVPAILLMAWTVRQFAVRPHEWTADWVKVGLVLAGIVIVGSPFASTYYRIDGPELFIRCGVFHWRIATASITNITPTHDPRSSPALSLDRLRIDYGAGKTILVSPKDKTGFVDALRVPLKDEG